MNRQGHPCLNPVDAYFAHVLAALLTKKDQDASSVVKNARTGIGTVEEFGAFFVYDMDHGFPLLSVKKTHWKSVMAELLWFISGSSNNNDLLADGVSIWNEWTRDGGELGPVYGHQWRHWTNFRPAVIGFNESQKNVCENESIDQLDQVLKTLRTDPTNRRMIVSAWNVGDLPSMALAPCHVMFQLNVDHTGRLNLMMTQRSADLFLGVPFNVASYAALLHIFAAMSGLKPGCLIHSIGSLHLYENHFDAAHELIVKLGRAVQESRTDDGEPKQIFPTPQISVPSSINAESEWDHIEHYNWDSFVVSPYQPWPSIKVPVAV